MVWRFQKSKKILPGVTLRLGKRSVNMRIGGRNAGVSLGSRGLRATASVPGTGVSVSQKLSGGSTGGSRGGKRQAIAGEYYETAPRGLFAKLVRAAVGVFIFVFGLGFAAGSILIHFHFLHWPTTAFVALIGVFFCVFALRFFKP